MTIEERALGAVEASLWIRESLRVHPAGARLTVTGTCMEPALIEGSSVNLLTPSGPPRLGDVLLLNTPNGLRLHRLLFRSGTLLRTKGDRGTFLDPPFGMDAVLAVAQRTENPARIWGRVLLSALRLGLRTVSGAGSDRAHAGVLPSLERVEYAPKDSPSGRRSS